MALAIDGSTPAIVTQTNGATTTLTTGSFTPPAGSLLLILWSANSTSGNNPATPTITDSLGGHLTYTLIDWQSHANAPSVSGQVATWWASVGSSAAMTVTVTNGDGGANSNSQAALAVVVLTGQAGSPIGAHGKSGSTSASSIAQSYTAQATGGWGFLVSCDWDALGTDTAGTGCTLLPSGSGTIPTTQISYAFERRTTADDTNGSNNTLNLTLPATSTNLTWAWVEVVPAVATAGTIEPLVVSPTWVPQRTTPILTASFPLGNPAVPTPQPLVVSAPWVSRVPRTLLFASPPTPFVAVPTPGPLVVTPPFAWVLIPPVTISASQPLGNPAVPTPGALVVSTAWLARVPGAQLFAAPSFAAAPSPLTVSPPFAWVPVPIGYLFTNPAVAPVVPQVPVEFVIEPPQRLWQIAMLSPSAGWIPDPPDVAWETALMSPSTEITIEPPRPAWEISMDVERISSLSLERIRFPVFADTAGTVYNPTGDAVSVAFLPTSADPQPTDFHAGTWDTTVIGTYVAQILVGPSGSVTLAKGTYYAWVKIVDSGGETIIRQVGQLIVD